MEKYLENMTLPELAEEYHKHANQAAFEELRYREKAVELLLKNWPDAYNVGYKEARMKYDKS